MIEQHLLEKQPEIALLCKEYGIRRLRVFGSAANGEFNIATSDYDFLVDWEQDQSHPTLRWLMLRDKLVSILGRSVDLVDDTNIRNPYFAIAARSEAVPFYG